MRKITENAANAFIAGNNWTGDNTAIRVANDNRFMYLFGNLIAEAINNQLYVTLAGWPTPTTRERINGLLELLGSGHRIVQCYDDQWLIHTVKSSIRRKIVDNQRVLIEDVKL